MGNMKYRYIYEYEFYCGTSAAETARRINDVYGAGVAKEYTMTRQQLKNSGKLMKKTCMPKNDVTEEEIGEIEQGKFIEDRRVMCYIACVYTMTQVVKNNKLNYDAVIKQVDVMFPQEMRTAVKAAAENCKDIAKKYKDLCEASYWNAKCMYDYDPANFIFP